MTKPSGAGDAEVVAILKRHKCPTPFHAVRTRFLGGIATPVLGASPIDTVAQLWGGDFPEFDSLDAVVEGLFGSRDHIDLPETAHAALGVLAELRSMLAGVVELLDDPSKPASADDLSKLRQNLQQMTMIAEAEISKAIDSCARARSHALELMSAVKPALH